MPDSYRQHADELRARAALERDAGRHRYLKGLARSYEELARQRGEWSERPKRPERPMPPALAERAALAALLRDQGYSQNRIAAQLGCSQQTISKTLLGRG
jgi:DNA invertase Pin-like site-specific DNA recombinase